MEAPRERRLARVIERDRISEADFAAAEAHPNEREVPLVRARADMIVENVSDRYLETVLRDVLVKLTGLGFGPAVSE